MPALALRNFYVDTSKDVTFAAPTAQTIWAPAANKRVYLASLTFTVDADCTVTIFFGTDATGNRLIYQKFVAGQGVDKVYLPLFRGPQSPTNGTLKVTATAGNINITATGFEL